MKISPFARRISIVGALLLIGGVSARAQTPATALVVAPELQTVEIKVRNVPANLMAYWLDPNHQEMPNLIKASLLSGSGISDAFASYPRQPGNGNGPRDVKLPDGIESLSALNENNKIRARGTAESLEQLQSLVKQLDVMLGEVEIEAQFIEFKPADLAKLKIKFRWTGAGAGLDLSQPAIAETAPDLATQLGKLMADDRAKVTSAPRVTAIDGLTAMLTSTETRSMLLSATKAPQEDVDFTELMPTSFPFPSDTGIYKFQPDTQTFKSQTDTKIYKFQPGFAMIQIHNGIRATPVLHDHLIAIDFQLDLSGQAAHLSAVWRNGQTLAVRLPQFNPKSTDVTVVFITPLIVTHDGQQTTPPQAIGLIGRADK